MVGFTAARNSGEVEVLLPWWPTFRRSARTTAAPWFSSSSLFVVLGVADQQRRLASIRYLQRRPSCHSRPRPADSRGRARAPRRPLRRSSAGRRTEYRAAPRSRRARADPRASQRRSGRLPAPRPARSPRARPPRAAVTSRRGRRNDRGADGRGRRCRCVCLAARARAGGSRACPGSTGLPTKPPPSMSMAFHPENRRAPSRPDRRRAAVTRRHPARAPARMRADLQRAERAYAEQQASRVAFVGPAPPTLRRSSRRGPRAATASAGGWRTARPSPSLDARDGANGHSSAPDPRRAAPRSTGGAQPRTACARQMGSAASSPSGAARRLASRPRSGSVGARRARSGVQPGHGGEGGGDGGEDLLHRGRAAHEGAAKGRWSTTSPAVAPAERLNERSQAISGSAAARTAASRRRCARPAARRPSARASHRRAEHRRGADRRAAPAGEVGVDPGEPARRRRRRSARRRGAPRAA